MNPAFNVPSPVAASPVFKVSDSLMALATRIQGYRDQITALEASITDSMSPAEIAKIKSDLNQINTDMGVLAPPKSP